MGHTSSKKIGRGADSGTGRYTTSRLLGNDFKVGQTVLGTGANGSVMLAEGKTNGKKYAVKSFNKFAMSPRHLDALRNEVEVSLLSLDHPNVVRLERIYETESELHIVMECLTGGDLYQRFERNGAYTEEEAAVAIRQMLLAIAYLHANNVVHRDLKLENFLYEQGDSGHLKVIDFGFATIWDGRTKMTEAVGTADCAAPEVFNHLYTNKADMWSLGVLSFNLLTGKHAFRGKDDIMACRRLPLLQVSSAAQDFVDSLLTLDSEHRLSATDALNHPWIRRYHQPLAVIDNTILRSLRQFAKARSFRRVCLSMMAWSLPCEHQVGKREQFYALANDNSGMIELGSLTQALSEHLGVVDGEVAALFHHVDTNHDGKITYSEFLAAVLDGDNNQVSEEMMQETFHRLGSDNNGKITAADMAMVCNLVDNADANPLIHESGCDVHGGLSYTEFQRWFRQGQDVCDNNASAEHAVIVTESLSAEKPVSEPHKPVSPTRAIFSALLAL